jgi:hypothetical protein
MFVKASLRPVTVKSIDRGPPVGYEYRRIPMDIEPTSPGRS